VDPDRAQFVEFAGQDMAVHVGALEQDGPYLPSLRRAGDHDAVDALQVHAEPVEHMRVVHVGAQIVLGRAQYVHARRRRNLHLVDDHEIVDQLHSRQAANVEFAEIAADRHRPQSRDDRDTGRDARHVRADLHIIGQEEDREDREDIGHRGPRQAGPHVGQHVCGISVAVDGDADVDRQHDREEVDAGHRQRIAEPDQVAEQAADKHGQAVDDQDHQAQPHAQRLYIVRPHARFRRMQFRVGAIDIHRFPPYRGIPWTSRANLHLSFRRPTRRCPFRLARGKPVLRDSTRFEHLSTTIVKPGLAFALICCAMMPGWLRTAP
jgi:hypothetical protein